MQSQVFDFLQLSKEPRVTSQLLSTQKIFFTSEVIKFNDSNKAQSRIIMMTNINIYNIQQSENFLKSVMSKLYNFNKKYTISRTIKIQNINAVTINNHESNCEVVLHVHGQHDYRFRVKDITVKKKFVKILCQNYEKATRKKMIFYIKNDVTLGRYCTMKTDLKTKISRIPKQNPIYLDVHDLIDFEAPDAKFQLLYSHNYCCVQISQFQTASLEGMKQNRMYFSIQSKTSKFQQIQEQLENRCLFINLPDYVYQCKENLYLIRPMMVGGKMDKLVSTLGSFKKQLCIFYISQLILVLEYLHSKGWVYRAMSLSNIYIKQNGYVAIDGLNKLMIKKNKDNQPFYDICGLPEDLSPEMILCQGHDESVDIWGLGLCAYNMIEGHHPFLSYNAKQTFKQILQKKIDEVEFLPSFVYKCLQKNPALRPSLQQIKKDTCFEGINWKLIQKQQIISPYIPELTSVSKWEGKLPSILYLQKQKN